MSTDSSPVNLLGVSPEKNQTTDLKTLIPGKLYTIGTGNLRKLLFIEQERDKKTGAIKFKFIDIDMPETANQRLDNQISKFNLIETPSINAETLLTSRLFGYDKQPDLTNVQSKEYYTIGVDGTPIKSKEKDQSKAPQGPYYWRKTELQDKYVFTTSPTSATNIQGGSYKAGNVKSLYNYYMKKVPRI